MKLITYGLIATAIALTSPLTSQSVFADKIESGYQQKVIVEDINNPWGMVQLPDGSFLISERAGELYLVNKEDGSKLEVKNLPEVHDNRQGGLMDLELHPDYAKNGWIYISFASPAGEGDGSNTAIMRARLKGLSLVDTQILYKGEPNSDNGRHYGSRIEFDHEGYMYFSIGDRGNRDVNPQDLTRDGGKVYRLHDDGRIPDDNPFVKTKNARAAIYSYGHRNPQGMEMNPVSGKIWTHEHGPKGGDELNIVAKGKNFGWPVISYGVNYSGSKFTEITEKKGMEQPVIHWTPSIAPSGMTFVTSDKYPELKGHLLVGSLKFNYLVLCKLDGDKVTEQTIIFENIGRVRNVKQMRDGYIYVATEGNGVIRLDPKS